MSEGIRWYRRDDMDDLAGQEPQFRLDLLRELVDELPPKQAHIISRTFFGGAPIQTAARELGVSPKHARELRTQAYASLRASLLGRDDLGALLSALVDGIGGGSVPVARAVEDAWCDARSELRAEDRVGPDPADVRVPDGLGG